jgi:glyoxylase-like metal-dependent hydrolase (beta-lactamase superfamily II)
MRAIDVRHLGNQQVICCWEVDGVLIDPGPESTLATLLEALGDERPRALLLTHIHFDHAGATGALLRHWPDLPVYVHERGAPHLVDPSRLVASAGRLYGGDEGLRRLWGEVVPVPEANLRVLRGGERDVEGAFRVEYTPGHASHHVCFLHEPSGWAFVGDTAGVRVPSHPCTLAPTPPPDVDVEAWEASIELVKRWEPVGLGLTHFGAAEDPAEQLERCREALHAEAELAARSDLDGFVAEIEARVRAEVGEEAPALLQAAPPDQLFQGLDRWRRKRAEARTSLRS